MTLRALQRLFTRSFALLIVGHFMQGMGWSSMLLLPLYLEHLRASRTEIGMIMATAGVSGLLIRPVVGWSLDRWGRKPTLVVGTLFLAAGMAIIGFCDRIGPAVYIARAVFGLGVGACFSGYFTFAADLVPAERRTEGLALFGISGQLPLLVNPLADRIHIEAADLRWFLPALSSVILLSLVAVALLREPAIAGSEQRPMREALTELRHRRLWSVWLATLAFASFAAAFTTFVTVAASHRGVTGAPTLWLAYALGAIIVRLLGARLPDRIGPTHLVAPSFVGYALAMVVAARVSSLNGFLGAAALAGLAHGVCFPVLTGQVVSRSPPAFRGSAVSAFTALWGLSELVVPPILGVIGDAYDDATMFYGAAGMGVLSLLAWMAAERRYGAD